MTSRRRLIATSSWPSTYIKPELDFKQGCHGGKTHSSLQGTNKEHPHCRFHCRLWKHNTSREEGSPQSRKDCRADRWDWSLLCGHVIERQRCRERAESIIRDALHPAHCLLRHKHSTHNLRHSREDSTVTYRNTFLEQFFSCHSETYGYLQLTALRSIYLYM